MKVEQPGDKFHAHLDACEQCREHPFDLCLIGASLLASSLDGNGLSSMTPQRKDADAL